MVMYLAYQLRNSFSGLAPTTDEACVQWVKGMIATGINLVALSFDEGVVGHVALFPIDEKTCEMPAAVSPPDEQSCQANVRKIEAITNQVKRYDHPAVCDTRIMIPLQGIWEGK